MNKDQSDWYSDHLKKVPWPRRKFFAFKQKVFAVLMKREGEWTHADLIGKHLRDPTKHYRKTHAALGQLRAEIQARDLGTLEKEGKLGFGFRWKYLRNPIFGAGE